MALPEGQRQAHEALVLRRLARATARRQPGRHGSDCAGLLLRRGGGVVRRSLLGQLAEDLLEVLGLAEVLVDGGEAHIGHVVEALQPLHDEFAHRLARHLAVAHALELAHDAVDHALDPLGLDRALAQRDLDRALQLVPVERAPAGRSA